MSGLEIIGGADGPESKVIKSERTSQVQLLQTAFLSVSSLDILPSSPTWNSQLPLLSEEVQYQWVSEA